MRTARARPSSRTTSENGTTRPMPDFHLNDAGRFEVLLHKTLQNLCPGREPMKTSTETPTAASPSSPQKFRPWGTMADTPNFIDPQCTAYVMLTTVSQCTGWRPRARGSAQPVGRPTRDGQVLRSARRPTIIGLDTLLLAVSWLTPSFTKTA